MISSSRLAELQHVPPAWKFCAVQSQERFDRENAQRADGRKWNTTARPRKTLRKRQAREEPSRDHPQGPRGSGMGLRGYCKLQAAQLRLQLQVLPGCADGGHVLRPTRGSSSPINPRLDSSSKTDLETCGKYRELKRKLSERALTQRKARAREEPSPGPPASETDARPPGHQPRGGAPARPRLSRGQEGPTQKARKFSVWQNLHFWPRTWI